MVRRRACWAPAVMLQSCESMINWAGKLLHKMMQGVQHISQRDHMLPALKNMRAQPIAEISPHKPTLFSLFFIIFSPVCLIKYDDLVPPWWKRHLLLCKHFDFISHNINAPTEMVFLQTMKKNPCLLAGKAKKCRIRQKEPMHFWHLAKKNCLLQPSDDMQTLTTGKTIVQFASNNTQVHIVLIVVSSTCHQMRWALIPPLWSFYPAARVPSIIYSWFCPSQEVPDKRSGTQIEGCDIHLKQKQRNCDNLKHPLFVWLPVYFNQLCCKSYRQNDVGHVAFLCYHL